MCLVNWLNPDKSLREQGIEETSMLTLRKKFFFSDQNVDRNDPIQLNLLFVQVLYNSGCYGDGYLVTMATRVVLSYECARTLN